MLFFTITIRRYDYDFQPQWVGQTWSQFDVASKKKTIMGSNSSCAVPSSSHLPQSAASHTVRTPNVSPACLRQAIVSVTEDTEKV